MKNLVISSSANEGSTDSTGVPAPTILATVGANHQMLEMASLALSIGVQHLILSQKTLIQQLFNLVIANCASIVIWSTHLLHFLLRLVFNGCPKIGEVVLW
jgi:hypothetical protein